MEKLQRRDLEQILGIYPPWKIKDITVDSVHEKLNVYLDQGGTKARFSFLSSPSREHVTTNAAPKGMTRYQWQHVRFGRFTTFIHADLPKSGHAQSGIPPVFLGDVNKQYTYQLAQTVALAKAKKLNEETISSLCGIDVVTVKAITTDIEASQSEKWASSLLPLETDAVWRAILTDDVNITTKLLPLKLLLSRLKLNVYNKKDSNVLQQSIAELRTFFVRHAQQLKSEYAQLGGHVPKAPSSNPSTQSNSKLILPGTKNRIWHEILSGSFELHSRNMPLNLIVSKLKKRYEAHPVATEQAKLVADLRNFFLKNARLLRAELTILTKMVRDASQSESSSSLPDLENQVWRQILIDDSIISSEKMNYRLLLARLRAIYHKEPDAAAEAQVIAQLRAFFDQNKRSMSSEIKQLAVLSSVS